MSQLTTDTYKYEVFISHASADKEEVVRPLYEALKARDIQAWLDMSEIKLGDNLPEKINAGLRESRFGVLVLSPNFFRYWPITEISALFSSEAISGEKRILPIRHNLSHEKLVEAWPLLAGRFSISTDEGIERVAEAIADVAQT